MERELFPERKDIMKKDASRLSDEMLEKVTGGLVVEASDGRYHAVDALGCVIVTANQREVAIYGAKMHGLSQNVITEAEYEQKFGRKLDENWNPYN